MSIGNVQTCESFLHRGRFSPSRVPISDAEGLIPKTEVLGWPAKEPVRDIYLTDDPADAAVLINKAIAGCLQDDVPEIQSLGRTLASWSTEILAHHRTGASNGPTEALNLSVKRVKRLRLRTSQLRPLPAACASPRRRSHLANPPQPTTNQGIWSVAKSRSDP